jgi:hypothetical protein
MTDNSKSKQNKNNNRNPTLRDHERMTGRSGSAVHEKGVSATTSRDDSIDRGARDHLSGGGRKSSRDSGYN